MAEHISKKIIIIIIYIFIVNSPPFLCTILLSFQKHCYVQTYFCYIKKEYICY